MLLSLFAATALAEPSLSVPYEMYTLENGLTVILAEDHSVPVVQVNIWYHVGSRDEVSGRTGFAHLFEHLMFQGSQHNNQDYFQPLQEIGAEVNGSTNLDRTNYFEGVPAQYLPLALWGEADRMAFLLEATDQARLDNQKEVVRNERRQRYENRPYGTAWLTLLDTAFPENHPYHHATIGYHEDLEAATLEDVQAFFRTWYVPNNASLVICGDFDPAVAKSLVRTYFGPIPASPEPPVTQKVDFTLTEEKVVRQVEAGVPFSRVWIAWPSAAVLAPGDAELDILASVLSNGKSSRLMRQLVVEQQIATDISAYQNSNDLAGLFIVEATAAKGHSTDEIVEQVDRILAELRRTGPSAEEVQVAVVNYEANFVDALSTVSGKANLLNSYYHARGEPDSFAWDLARYAAVTPESVKAVSNQWLGTGRVVLHITPEVTK